MVPANDSTVFVTFTCSNDVHYAKALLGSIAHFYPNHGIHVVCENDVSSTDIEQFRGFPNTIVHRVPELINQHKLNLTGLLSKFNVLFLPGVDKALVADADSILIDLVLSRVPPTALFWSLAGRPVELSRPEEMAQFSRWCIDIQAMPELKWTFRESSIFYVGGSHFFIDVGRFPKELFYQMLPYMGYSHGTPTPLRAGDQGFWNYLVNCWQPPSGSEMEVLDVAPCATLATEARLPRANDNNWLSERCVKTASFIHYIGFSRRLLRRQHIFAGPLCWATREYYRRLPHSRHFVRDECRRIWAKAVRACRTRLTQIMSRIVT